MGIEIIHAGAGSGKTYKLTNLVIEKLRADLAPEALMTTTFTNKAAAELRERIRLRLLKHNKLDEAQRISSGFIGTVNSICARLLTSYALDAGLSPALDVLPEEDSKRLFKIAITSVIKEHADEIEPAAARMGRDGRGFGYQKRPDWRADVQRIVELARVNQLSVDALSACARQSWDSLRDLFGAPLEADINKQLDAAVQNAISNLEEIAEPKKTTQKSLGSLRGFARFRERKVVIPWVEWVRLSKLSTNKEGEGLLDDVNRIAGDVLKHPGFQADARQMIEGVFTCASEALEAYKTFKQKQGLMDFMDQETMVLDLARDNEAFRESMKDRLEQIMVDEFQDTSPIQLALFLKLHELAGKSIWVGDPKQAIYGFRGTDPQLMDEAIKLIGSTQTLDKSWRSREVLVKFCNAVFSKVFHESLKEKVSLKIPDERKEEAKGGWIESWNLAVPNNTEEAGAIANGVKDMLKRCEEIKPGDIAVLCRTNAECERIAGGLEALGIRASVAQGSLLETRECQLALAVLRYMQDEKDTVALAEIVHLSHQHADHNGWLTTLVRDKDDAVDQWKLDPLIVKIDKACDGLKHLTPMEALELAIGRGQVERTCKSWSRTAARMNNLDALRGVCSEYLDQCRARRTAATVAGFITYVNEADPSQAQGSGEKTVQVLTYHGAKGLEWPVVVLAGLDAGSRASAFGVNVVPAPKFDPADPLANRSISFWPWPFGAQRNLAELDNKLEDRDEEINAQMRERTESRRLLYVGMTRARDGVVFAMRKRETKTEISLKTAWLDELTDKEGYQVLKWPLKTGEQELKVSDSSVPITVREFSADDLGEMKIESEEDNYLAKEIDDTLDYPRARIWPSSLEDSGEFEDVVVETIADFGRQIDVKENPDPPALGNAVHGFLGIDDANLTNERQLEIATRLLRAWGVEKSITPADLLTIHQGLEAFIEKTYPAAKVLREWPITLINDEHQLMQGWVDMLLETPMGYVVIDHKSYVGADASEYVKKYAAQLAIYRQAVEKATGKDVLATLLHMPMLGKMFGLSGIQNLR